MLYHLFKIVLPLHRSLDQRPQSLAIFKADCGIDGWLACFGGLGQKDLNDVFGIDEGLCLFEGYLNGGVENLDHRVRAWPMEVILNTAKVLSCHKWVENCACKLNAVFNSSLNPFRALVNVLMSLSLV